MNNNTAKELLDLARHYEQFNINSADVELLKKAAKELESYSKVCEDTGEIPPNTYIKIESEEHSKYVQELAFKNGFEWRISGMAVKYTSEPFLVFHSDDRITWSNNREDTINHEEIFVDMVTGVVSYSKQ